MEATKYFSLAISYVASGEKRLTVSPRIEQSGELTDHRAPGAGKPGAYNTPPGRRQISKVPPGCLNSNHPARLADSSEVGGLDDTCVAKVAIVW
jgi:hypothetical protein